MAKVIKLKDLRDAAEDRVGDRFCDLISEAMAASMTSGDPIRTDLLLAELQTAANVIGLTRARELFGNAWSACLECFDDAVKIASRELDAAEAYDPRVPLIQ
jgi:hypothetical protein